MLTPDSALQARLAGDEGGRLQERLREHVGRWWHPATVALVVVGGARFIRWIEIQPPVDWWLYRDAALRWQAGGGYFFPDQLTGGPLVHTSPVLYPPVILWLLVPFAHLPALLWWAVPAGLLAGAILWLRPRGWWLPLMAVLAMAPFVQGIYLTGRPTMWVAAFLALGLCRGGWAALVLIKPSVFPFALAGIHRRSWWLTLLGLIVLSLPFGSLWLDWVTAIQNSHFDLLYSLPDALLLAIPVAAWLGRTSGDRGHHRHQSATARIREVLGWVVPAPAD